MGLMIGGVLGRVLGMGGAVREIGQAVGGVAEVFVGNQAERDAAAEARYSTAVEQYAAEFGRAGGTWFDGFVNGLNRLPRPMLAIGTLGLFVYAMAEPNGFGVRMQGLALVPEPLWWLLTAIVSFYFGARELHHYRIRTVADTAVRKTAAAAGATPARLADLSGVATPADPASIPAPLAARAGVGDPDYNAAVEEWSRLRG